MNKECEQLMKNNGLGYLMLVLAQEECRRYVGLTGKLENAELCNDVYSQFMAAREACAAQFVKQTSASTRSER